MPDFYVIQSVIQWGKNPVVVRVNDKMTMSKETITRTQRMNGNHQLKGNKQARTIKYTCDTGYMCMDLSFLVYFPLSNFKLYLILVFVMFFYCSKSIKVI